VGDSKLRAAVNGELRSRAEATCKIYKARCTAAIGADAGSA